MKNSNGLDPANGDYVKYIDDIQKGKIKPRGALKPPSGMLEMPIESSSSENTPKENKRRASRNPPAFLQALTVFLTAMGFALVAFGIFSESDAYIPLGMFTLFAGFVFNMNLKK